MSKPLTSEELRDIASKHDSYSFADPEVNDLAGDVSLLADHLAALAEEKQCRCEQAPPKRADQATPKQRAVLDHLGLTDWVVKKILSGGGLCVYSCKEIWWDPEFGWGGFLHEVAHALLPKNQGHNVHYADKLTWLFNTYPQPREVEGMEQTNYNIAELADWCEAMCSEGVAGAGLIGMPGVLSRYREQLQPIAECLRNQAKMERESNALRAELSKLRGEDNNLSALVAKLTHQIEAYREDNEKLRPREAAIKSGDAVMMRKSTLEKWLSETFLNKESATQYVAAFEWEDLKLRAGKEE